LIGENSKDLALFSGSVFEGRKRFADLNKTMDGPVKTGLMNLGMSVQEIADGTMGYLRIQTRLGRAQSMTNDQLADGAARYLKEQDALAKVTGQSRKEMEEATERALQGEQFAAKVRQLQMSGQGEAAEKLIEMNKMYGAMGPKTQAGFQAIVTGNLANKDAQTAFRASQGEMMRSTQRVIAGQQDAAGAVQGTMKRMGETSDKLGTTLGQLGAYENNFGSMYEQQKGRQLAEGNFAENLKKAAEEQKKQGAAGGTAADAMVSNQVKLVQTQIEINKALETFVKDGIIPTQKAMQKLADIALKGANTTADMGPKGAVGLAGTAAGAFAGAKTGMALGALAGPIGAAIGVALGGIVGGFLGKSAADAGSDAVGLPGRSKGSLGATGKMIEDFGKGTPMMLHGKEGVITEKQLHEFANSAMEAGLSAQKISNRDTATNTTSGKISETKFTEINPNTNDNLTNNLVNSEKQVDTLNKIYLELTKQSKLDNNKEESNSQLFSEKNATDIKNLIGGDQKNIQRQISQLLEKNKNSLTKQVNLEEKVLGSKTEYYDFIVGQMESITSDTNKEKKISAEDLKNIKDFSKTRDRLFDDILNNIKQQATTTAEIVSAIGGGPALGAGAGGGSAGGGSAGGGPALGAGAGGGSAGGGSAGGGSAGGGSAGGGGRQEVAGSGSQGQSGGGGGAGGEAGGGIGASLTTPSGNVVGRLLEYIGKKESNGNYNILVGGKTEPNLTNMTIAEVQEYQRGMIQRGHESTAVGKYQIIRKTLQGLVAQGYAKPEDKFSAGIQDRLAIGLLKNRGLEKYQAGKMPKDQFADNLSKEWASLPYNTGQSYYAGVGSNKSSGSRNDFMTAFARNGGTFNGPDSGYPAVLHGPEAVVPLPDGKTIPVRLENSSDFAGNSSADTIKSDMRQMMTEFKNSMTMMMEQTNNKVMINIMDELLRAQKTSNDIQKKMLQAQS